MEFTPEGGLRAAQGYRIVRVTKAERRHSILSYSERFEFEFDGQTWPAERTHWLTRKPIRKRRESKR